MNDELRSERCFILRCLADMAWAEDEAEVEKGYESAKEAMRKYYDGLVERLAEKEKGFGVTENEFLPEDGIAKIRK